MALAAPGASPRRGFQTSACTLVALAAFAANSLLCREALGAGEIDAASFTAIRLVSGAAVLLLVTAATGKGSPRIQGGWFAAALLFLYALPFSCAYLDLSAGTGALILFGSVQLTMMGAALRAGERPRPWQWAGLLLATGGLAYLVSPGFAAPPPAAFALMAAAGVAWGLYSLRGRVSADPLAATAGNFLRAVPLALIAGLIAARPSQATPRGALLAVLSGALASGLGYVVWYAALAGLTATRAAAAQLAVPILAAGGGVLFLDERVTLRLLLAAVLILGGIALAWQGRGRSRP